MNLFDRVFESATVVGSGDFTLLGAKSGGWQSFSVWGANTSYYCGVDSANNAWEVGSGVYSAGVLRRSGVLRSSQGGSKVNFASGTMDVFGDAPADMLAFLLNPAASGVSYSNTLSGLNATTTQSAIDALNAVVAGQSSNPQGSWLASGGGVAYVSGLTFDVAPAAYYIIGILYNSGAATKTLAAADPTHDRFDVIAVDTTGSVVVVQGTAAANPLVPTLDPQTQLGLAIISVQAGATTPSGVTSLTLYAENAGTPTEWAASTSNSGTVNVASTNFPHAGTKDIEGTGVAANTTITLTAAAAVDVTAYANLVFYVRSKGTWGSKSLSIQFLNGTTPVGVPVSLVSGTFAFNSATTGSYQAVVIPLSQFALAGGTLADRVRFTVLGGGGNIGFYLDDFSLQGGVSNQGAGLTQSQADARYLKQSANLSDLTSASTARTNLGLGSAATHAATDFLSATDGTGGLKTITQATHGFVVGNVLRLSGSTYVLAKSDAAANAEVVGIVASVIDTNTFRMAETGSYITGLSGLTAGTVYFLSPSSAGSLTATDAVASQVSKPLLTADSTTSGWFIIGRGLVVTASNTLDGIAYGTGTGFGTTAAMTDGQLLLGQTSAAPLPKTVTGDATFSAAGAMALGSGVVTDTKASISWKPWCRLVATSNYPAATAPSGLFAIDSQTPIPNDPILLAAQTGGSGNGPWVAASGVWSRPTWFPSGGTTQAFRNSGFEVYDGNSYGGSMWRVTNTGAITIDTTAIALQQVLSNLNNTGSGQTSANVANTIMSRDNSGGFAAAKITNQIQIDSHYGTLTVDSDGATITFDCSVGNEHTVTLGGARILALSNAQVGQTVYIELVQPSSGGPWSVAWFSGITWMTASGLAPALTTAAGSATVVGFVCTGSGAYRGYLIGPPVNTVVEGDLSLIDVTTGDVSTSKHGLMPKLPNDGTEFYDGAGVWRGFPIACAMVNTDETQAAGASYGDLATPGPSVTLTLKGTTAIVMMSAMPYRTTTGNTCYTAVEVSGSSTVAAADANSVAIASDIANAYLPVARVILLTGLTPGSNTFKLKYRNDGGTTWHFSNRSIMVFAP